MSRRVALAALGVDLSAVSADAPASFRVIPSGEFRAWDGRPSDCSTWRCDAADGARLVAELNARARASVIDYEHATLKAKKDAVKAPAAGWFKTAEWRDDGVYLTGVEWTAQAAREITDKAYRYISPVFAYDRESGHVLMLRHIALTNEPGLDGLTDLAALAALAAELFTDPQSNLPEDSVNETMKKLLAALGLQESATETEALSAIAALKTNVASLSVRDALPPDPAKYAPVSALAALQAEKAELSGQLAALAAEKVDAAIRDALGNGKLSPGLEGWARDLGKSNIAALSAYLDKAVPGVSLGKTQTGGHAPAGAAGSGSTGLAALTAEEQTAARIGGWDASVFQPTQTEQK